MFSLNGKAKSIPYIEKALAVHVGGYEKLASLKSLPLVYQHLNYD